MPKDVGNLKNVTGLIVYDGLDSLMGAVNQMARQIQSTIIEGQSAGAGATLAFGEDIKAIKNLEALRAMADAKIYALIKEIECAGEMSVDADQLEMAGKGKGYSLPPAIPFGDD